MKITKYGHACLLIEEAGEKILTDPGAFSSGFEDIDQLGAILVTHQHQDHFVVATIQALVAHSPQVKVYADETSAELLDQAGVSVQIARARDEFKIGDVSVGVYGRDHVPIHAEIAGIPNVGYMIAERFFYPGDAFTLPGKAVEILAVPVAAPWLKVGEVVDYLRAVRPQIIIPVHDAILSAEGLKIHLGVIDRLTKDLNLEVRVAGHGLEEGV